MAKPSLPHPNSTEVARIARGAERKAIYTFLYERQNDPPTMLEIQEHVAQVLGKARAQTGRRMRELRKHFEILAVRDADSPRTFRYRLVRRRSVPGGNRSTISSRLEAEIFTAYGHRCAMCGRSPEVHGVELVIDHKIPLHLGGTNERRNLQPLCIEHNHGKQALFQSIDRYSDAVRIAISKNSVHERIGELLMAMKGTEVPVGLINIVARESNRGDPTRRLRELRTLGWEIGVRVRRKGGVSESSYILEHAEPWPNEGAAAAIRALERKRAKLKRLKPKDPFSEKGL